MISTHTQEANRVERSLPVVSGVRKQIRLLRKHAGLLILTLPGALALFIFNYLPLYGLVLPFKNYRYDLGFLGSSWSGLKNFEFLFKGEAMLRAIRNTLGYNMAFIFLGTLASVVVALLLFELGKRSVKTYQTILFFPYFVSWVVAGFAFRALFDMDYGMLNAVLALVGKDPVMWYNDPRYWPVILVIIAIWKGLGYGSVIYYAALMGIDAELFEAARIDGANRFQQSLYISVPMIQPIVVMMIILQIGKIFYSDFGLFYNVPMNSSLLYPSTDVIDTFVYRALVDLGDIGMAAAAGFVQAVVGFVLVIATNMIVRIVNKENALF